MKLTQILILFSVISLTLVTRPYSASAEASGSFGQLSELADHYGTDKGPNSQGFTLLYEHFFYPIKQDVKKVFEIGVFQGASLKMFKDYFPQAVVYGIDIHDTSEFDSERSKTFIADQSSRSDLKSFIDKYGSDFDIILDDGGHTMNQQQISFGYLFQHVKPGGYYIIEDVHTSLKRPGYSGVEFMKWNTTLRMINHYMKTGEIKSKYMTDEEKKILTASIEYVNLFRSEKKVLTCIVKKKS